MDKSYYYKKGLCGLKNCGNTCYINSITQCLNNDRDLIDYLLTEDYKEDLNKKTNIDLLEHFIELSKELYNKNSVIHPGKYMYKIKEIA